MKTYNDAVELLTSVGKFRISLGLERITKILELLGNPQDKLDCIHVAGTNGKGSVCAILTSILKESGKKVGLYTSPHIFKYNERIKILDPTPTLPQGEGINSLDNDVDISNCRTTCPPLEGGPKSLISRRGNSIPLAKHSYVQSNIQLAKNLRNNSTKQEVILWQYLKGKQLCGVKFRRQQPIGNYIVDFVSMSEKIIIELDGSQHNSDDGQLYDKERDNFLSDLGYKVIRIWNNDIDNNIEGVIDSIRSAILDPNPTLPQEEGINSLDNDVDISNCRTTCPPLETLPSKTIQRIVLREAQQKSSISRRGNSIFDDCITDEDFSKYVFEISELAQQNNIDLTEFEILTAVMFKYFADNNVDVVILETGLGGRFDATNVIKKNLCSIITHVDFDHTERLGKTISEIAYEKAGIIKSGCPCIVFEGMEVYHDVAFELNSLLMVILPFADTTNLALKGVHQQENLALALAAIETVFPEIDKQTIENGLKNVKHPFRFEYFEDKNLIIDGAHNPNGIQILAQNLDMYYPNTTRRFIFGCLKNKDYKQMVNTLFNLNDEVYFYHFNHNNSCTFEDLQQVSPVNAKELTDFTEIDFSDDKLTIICGSLYMISELVENLNIKF